MLPATRRTEEKTEALVSGLEKQGAAEGPLCSLGDGKHSCSNESHHLSAGLGENPIGSRQVTSCWSQH